MFNFPHRNGQDGAKQDREPYSWLDLDQLGLPRDHIFRHYKLTGRCWVCESQHHYIRWCIKDYRHTQRSGWVWRCADCTQEWRSPQIIPAIKSVDK